MVAGDFLRAGQINAIPRPGAPLYEIRDKASWRGAHRFAERILAHESFKGFDAEGEFAERQRSFCGEAARTKAFQVFCRRVFRAVDDPQIFATAAFHGWLNQPPPILGYEIQPFHHQVNGL